MADLILRRYCYGPTATLGRLELPSGRVLFTVERPWLYNQTHGSEPFKSCVPDGPYTLEPHDSDKHGQTWALVNADLKVHHYDTGNGRYACLVHVANSVAEVVGCIGPGTSADAMRVLNSRDAMAAVRAELGAGTAGHRLIIIPDMGTTQTGDF